MEAEIWKMARRVLKCLAAYALLTTTMSGCHHKADKEHSDIAGIIPQQENDNEIHATEAKRIAHSKDTLGIYFNESLYKVSRDGNIYAPDGRLTFKVKGENIQKMYFCQKGEDIFLFFTEKGKDDASNTSKILRLNTQNNNVIWEVDMRGGEITRPLIKGQFAYVGSWGLIGKLKLKNGQFDWKYSSMDHDGRFCQFDEIDFIRAREVRYIAPHKFSMERDTVIINDITGEIIRTN